MITPKVLSRATGSFILACLGVLVLNFKINFFILEVSLALFDHSILKPREKDSILGSLPHLCQSPVPAPKGKLMHSVYVYLYTLQFPA